MAELTRKELLEKRGDLSQFLIHLTRSGDLKLDKDIYSLARDQVVQVTAKTSLAAIIKSRRIDAKSAFGYFTYKVPMTRADGRNINANSLVKRDWLRAACFTETPLDHIYLQTQKVFGRQSQSVLSGEPFLTVTIS